MAYFQLFRNDRDEIGIYGGVLTFDLARDMALARVKALAAAPEHNPTEIALGSVSFEYVDRTNRTGQGGYVLAKPLAVFGVVGAGASYDIEAPEWECNDCGNDSSYVAEDDRCSSCDRCSEDCCVCDKWFCEGCDEYCDDTVGSCSNCDYCTESCCNCSYCVGCTSSVDSENTCRDCDECEDCCDCEHCANCGDRVSEDGTCPDGYGTDCCCDSDCSHAED